MADARVIEGWRWCHGALAIKEWEEDEDFGCVWCPEEGAQHDRLLRERDRGTEDHPAFSITTEAKGTLIRCETCDQTLTWVPTGADYGAIVVPALDAHQEEAHG